MKKIVKISLFFTCLLSLTSCAGTLAYTPNQQTIRAMSFQEAKNTAETLFAQTVPRGSLKVHIDCIELSSPNDRSNCYFDAMSIDVKDYGPLSGQYQIGDRYSVSLGEATSCKYIMFRSYDDATSFANAAYILKNTPLNAKKAFLQSIDQEDNITKLAKHEGKTEVSAISIALSDVDELPTVTAKPNKNAYAIVIGVEKYRQKLPKADYADNDARIMAEYLTNVMGYPEENIVTLLNDRALKSDFEKYFEKWLGNNVEKGSSVFIYFSGHGAPNTKTGDAYLVPYDGDPTFIDQTGYSLKRMYDALGKLQAKEIIVALDSCFSGAGGRSVIAKGARPLVMNLQSNMFLSKNMTVLSASSGDQISSTYDEKGHGLFTYFMLKGIKNEVVVMPDGSIRMDDLFGYLKPQVERIARKQYNNEQTPQLIGAKKN